MNRMISLPFTFRSFNNSMAVTKDLAKYTIAAKALCMPTDNFHGVNLQELLNKHLNFFKNNTLLDVKVEQAESYMWLLLAMTLTGTDVTSDQIAALKHNQQGDGSFNLPGYYTIGKVLDTNK